MSEKYKPNYFILRAQGTDVFVDLNPDTEQYKRTEYIFNKPFEEILRESNASIVEETCCVFPLYMYLYRLKEPDCEYELVGMTGDNLKRTYLHLLRKRNVTDNIE